MVEKIDILTQNIPPYGVNLIILAAAIIVGSLLKFAIIRLMVFYHKKKVYSVFKSIITHLGRPLTWFIPLLILNFMMPWLVLPPKTLFMVEKALHIALIIAFSVLLVRMISVFEAYIFYRFDIGKTDNLQERKIRTQLQFLRKFGITMIVIITLAAILLSFESMRRIGTGLITSVGIGGIIVGFAAQKSLGNLFAGFQIAITQPIRIDDVLVVEKEYGHVEEITLTYVVIRLWDLRRLILPINYFIEQPFQNWTRMSADIMGTVFLYVDYTLPVEAVRAELTRLLESNTLWDKKVNALQVTDTKENTIELRALMSAASSSDTFDLRCYIRENLVKFIQQNFPESLPKMRATLSAEPAVLKQNLAAAAEPTFFPKN